MQQLTERTAGQKNICSVHRLIWRDSFLLPTEQGDQLREHIITAYIMGKKMADRLLYHYNDKRKGY